MLLISPIMKRLLSTLILLLGFNVSAQEQDPCYSVNDFMFLTEGENSSITKNFVGGWNMFGYPCSQEKDVVDAFSSIIDKVLIVKSNNGSVYMPEFGFNGIGFLEGGEGYQIKMSNTEYGFSFCEPIIWPNLEGCTDCEAVNFNQWANVDDGSCNYDSDGDGIPDFEEVIGCQDSLACDYNIAATDSGECSYPQNGYDCNGNMYVEIGDTAFGGVVFYFDSVDLKGFVMYNELPDNWNVGGGRRPWGCSDIYVPDCGYTQLEYSLHNTMQNYNTCNEVSLPNLYFTEYLNAAKTSIDLDINNYSDWFLPSLDLTILMVGNLLGSVNEVGNTTVWTSTQVDETQAYWVSGLSGEFYAESKIVNNRVIPVRAFGNWTMGCMDETACNYNSEVNMADGSCEYAEQGYDCVGNIIAQIGDIIEGGYLFYLNETNTGGLVAAFEDIGAYEWGCFNDNVQGADRTQIGTGYQNTLDIFNQGCTEQNGSLNAASRAFEYESDNYNDWYLPSKDELSEMYTKIGNGSIEGNIGNFSSTWYWSSSEINNSTAWYISFSNFLTSTGNKNNPDLVRPIRAFGNWTMGCMDETACNYNPEANMADNSCVFPEQGYDCGGNINVQVGDESFGGIVFYIDESGQRGLVAAIEDLDNLYTWGCQGVNILTDLSLGYGLDNTLKIIDNCSESPIAASEVLDIEIGGFADWFLPSQDELILMWASIGQGSSLDNFGGFSANFYYSSSQKTNMAAYGKYFPTGEEYEVFKNSSAKIRPIRAFGDWIMGCMDSLACNYNPEANMADGSCTYADLGYDCDGNITEYVVGMEAEGGIVFYVDETGEHGLVAALEDIGQLSWGCYGLSLPGADGTSIGTGYQNTIDIVQGCSHSPIAASEALAYEEDGFSDWYLPSKDELFEMFLTIGNGGSQGNIGGFVNDLYWTSSDDSVYYSWFVDFENGSTNDQNKSYTYYVRPIRSF